MNLLAETYLTLASYPTARGREVVKSKLAEAALIGHDIPDRFWLELLQLNLALISDLLPEAWEPSAFVWNDAISNYQDQPDVLKLLLKRYGSKIKIDEISDYSWGSLGELLAEHVSVTSENITNAANLSKNKLRWLATYAPATFEGVCQEHSKPIMSDTFLIEKTPVKTLRAWASVRPSPFEYPKWGDILKKIIPQLKAPFYAEPEVSIHLQNCIQDSNERSDSECFVDAFVRLQPVQYMDWVAKAQLEDKTRMVKMRTHWRIIADHVELWPLITKELEYQAYAEPTCRNLLDYKSYPWKHVQQLAQAKEPSPATAGNLVLSMLSEHSCKNKELFLGMVKTLKDLEPDSFTVKTGDVTVFDAIYDVCTPKAREHLLRAGLCGDSNIVVHILGKYDVSSELPHWTFPKTSFWINSLEKIHPANLKALLARLGEPEIRADGFHEIDELHHKLIELHPQPEFNLLVQAIVAHYSEFQTKHLTDGEFSCLFKTAQIAKRSEALTNLRRQKKQRKKIEA